LILGFLWVSGGWNFVDSTSNYSDDNGHDTHVMGINNDKGVVGIAPSVQVYTLKVTNSNGNYIMLNCS
jgi:subtilisin